jgi:hypothetical protein
MDESHSSPPKWHLPYRVLKSLSVKLIETHMLFHFNKRQLLDKSSYFWLSVLEIRSFGGQPKLKKSPAGQENGNILL